MGDIACTVDSETNYNLRKIAFVSLQAINFLQILIESEQLPGGVRGSHDIKEPIIMQPDNLAVCAVIKLLRTIAIDGFR